MPVVLTRYAVTHNPRTGIDRIRYGIHIHGDMPRGSDRGARRARPVHTHPDGQRRRITGADRDRNPALQAQRGGRFTGEMPDDLLRFVDLRQLVDIEYGGEELRCIPPFPYIEQQRRAGVAHIRGERSGELVGHEILHEQYLVRAIERFGFMVPHPYQLRKHMNGPR